MTVLSNNDKVTNLMITELEGAPPEQVSSLQIIKSKVSILGCTSCHYF